MPREAVNITIPPTAPPSEVTRLYNVTWTNTPQFGLTVKRKSNDEIVYVISHNIF